MDKYRELTLLAIAIYFHRYIFYVPLKFAYYKVFYWGKDDVDICADLHKTSSDIWVTNFTACEKSIDDAFYSMYAGTATLIYISLWLILLYSIIRSFLHKPERNDTESILKLLTMMVERDHKIRSPILITNRKTPSPTITRTIKRQPKRTIRRRRLHLTPKLKQMLRSTR